MKKSLEKFEMKMLKNETKVLQKLTRKNNRNKINTIIKEVKIGLLSITLLIQKFQEKMQELSIETCQKKGKIKKGNIKEKDST